MPIMVGNLKLFDLKELSELIGVSTVTIRGYISSGKLVARKMGSKYYISEDALRGYFTTIDTENLTVSVQRQARRSRGEQSGS